MKYKDYEICLEPGSKIFVYTDGVPEATNANNELFGDDRLLEAVKGTENLNSPETLKKVRSKIDEFVGDAPQFDDLTMLALRIVSFAEEKGEETDGE